MAVALCQCLGGAATCANTIEGLNRLADVYGVDAVNSTAFGIMLNEHMVILYVMWENEKCFRQQFIDIFVLFMEDDIEWFRNVLKNILTWGEKIRLSAIQAALDKITESMPGLESEVKENRKSIENIKRQES